MQYEINIYVSLKHENFIIKITFSSPAIVWPVIKNTENSKLEIHIHIWKTQVGIDGGAWLTWLWKYRGMK